LLVRGGNITSVRYDTPFFVINDNLVVLLKYSTKARSPWGFTFTPDEQNHLQSIVLGNKIIIGLICGADGVAAVPFDDFLTIAALRSSSVHIACYRKYGKYYDVAGPDGNLSWKISPSNWQRILKE